MRKEVSLLIGAMMLALAFAPVTLGNQPIARYYVIESGEDYILLSINDKTFNITWSSQGDGIWTIDVEGGALGDINIDILRDSINPKCAHYYITYPNGESFEYTFTYSRDQLVTDEQREAFDNVTREIERAMIELPESDDPGHIYDAFIIHEGSALALWEASRLAVGYSELDTCAIPEILLAAFALSIVALGLGLAAATVGGGTILALGLATGAAVAIPVLGATIGLGAAAGIVFVGLGAGIAIAGAGLIITTGLGAGIVLPGILNNTTGQSVKDAGGPATTTAVNTEHTVEPTGLGPGFLIFGQ